jgi:hypothetical protein
MLSIALEATGVKEVAAVVAGKFYHSKWVICYIGPQGV